MANYEQEIRNKQFKKATGSAPTFRSIDGVGPKTAAKLDSVRQIQSPSDAADYSAEELAETAGISERRAEKTIRAGGGLPSVSERGRSSGSVGAGNLADSMDSARKETAQRAREQSDVLSQFLQLGDRVPDERRKRRRPREPVEGVSDLEEDELEEVARTAGFVREATQDPLDPTESAPDFGFTDSRLDARGKATSVAEAARGELARRRDTNIRDVADETRFLGQQEPDFETVESAAARSVAADRDIGSQPGGFRGVSQPTDIGREPDGEFGRPDTAAGIDPAPVARNTESGEFGLDPFDITANGVGESVELFGGDRK